MTIKEVCEDIRLRSRDRTLYTGIMSRSLFCKTLRNVTLGKAKLSTIEKFFTQFNYTGSFNEWHKTEEK